MKIFSAKQIKAWDQYTIENEPVLSIDLMERAAEKCVEWIENNFGHQFSFIIFCGRGNNGGDGLAIARLLKEKGFRVKVYVVGTGAGSSDFEMNRERYKGTIQWLRETDDFPNISRSVIVDALFGSGLNRPVTGIYQKLITYINKYGRRVIAIDVPSGMFLDSSSKNSTVIRSDYILSFQNYKLAFLLAENAHHFRKIILMDIQLSHEFEKGETPEFELTEAVMIQEIYKPRKPFSHKGDFGYACIIAGSFGMMGAAVLSARACLRSGVGKLICFVPEKGYEIMQVAVPEAMVGVYGIKYIEGVEGISDFDVIGIGPGIGKHFSHFQLLKNVFENFKKPLVADADALNTLAEYPELLEFIPANSVLTPHPKEFERMFGKTQTDFEKIHLALKMAVQYKVHIILKGHRTFIATPEGKDFFNSTGNAGMSTAGSGDVLTGIVSGLLAQKYTPCEACLLGVYIHGLAGDFAAESLSQEAMTAGDIIDFLPKAFNSVSGK